LTFCDVLKTNCNSNPGVEVVHGEIMPFRRLALHFICVILTKKCLHMLILICYHSKTKILRISSFEML